jgi:hypothetical protein
MGVGGACQADQAKHERDSQDHGRGLYHLTCTFCQTAAERHEDDRQYRQRLDGDLDELGCDSRRSEREGTDGRWTGTNRDGRWTGTNRDGRWTGTNRDGRWTGTNRDGLRTGNSMGGRWTGNRNPGTGQVEELACANQHDDRREG